VDLYLITAKLCAQKITSGVSDSQLKQVSQVLFNMIGFINFTLASKYSVLQRKALSIRDIINAIDFTKECIGLL
jgi:hypothetical protein